MEKKKMQYDNYWQWINYGRIRMPKVWVRLPLSKHFKITDKGEGIITTLIFILSISCLSKPR